MNKKNFVSSKLCYRVVLSGLKFTMTIDNGRHSTSLPQWVRPYWGSQPESFVPMGDLAFK